MFSRCGPRTGNGETAMLPRSLARMLIPGIIAALSWLACSDTTFGPVAPPPVASRSGAGDPALRAEAMVRETTLARQLFVRAIIGAEGGTLSLPEAGLTLVVPPGAVRSPTTFTATALAGGAVAYDFGPHGSIFPVALQVVQELEGTSWWRASDLSTIEAAHFTSLDCSVAGRCEALVSEFLPVTLDIERTRLRFEVKHFSGYLVSMGRGG